MSLRLKEPVPNFTQDSSMGEISLYDWAGDSWVILFSYPADFTPVCNIEIAEVARLKPEFDKFNVKTLGVSVQDLDTHLAWIKDLAAKEQITINYPILADANHQVVDLYDMIHPGSDANVTVRTLFVIDPSKKLRMHLVYPLSTGRSFPEILRVIEALQLTDEHKIVGTCWDPTLDRVMSNE